MTKVSGVELEPRTWDTKKWKDNTRKKGGKKRNKSYIYISMMEPNRNQFNSYLIVYLTWIFAYKVKGLCSKKKSSSVLSKITELYTLC